MSTFELLRKLRAQGVELKAESGRLRYKGPRGALTPDLIDELKNRKSDILRSLEGEAGAQLTQGQRALWLLQRLAPSNVAYNLVSAAEIDAGVRLPELRRTLEAVLERNELLRSRFPARDGQPAAEIRPDPLDFEVVSTLGWKQSDLRAWLSKEADRPFDLQDGPLVRFRLLAEGKDEKRQSQRSPILALTIHHFAADFWGVEALLDEIETLYAAAGQNRLREVPPPAAQHSRFVLWEKDQLQGPNGERLEAFWRRKLEGVDKRLDLPVDRPRPSLQSYAGDSLDSGFEASDVDRIRSLARSMRTTPFTVVQAAFAALLHRYSGQDSLLVATPVARRDRPEFERLIAYCANPLPLRADFAGSPSFRALTEQAREGLIDAIEHSALPFPSIVDELCPERDPARPPLCQVAFVWARPRRTIRSRNGASGEGLMRKTLLFDQRGAAYELVLSVREEGEDLFANWRYATDLFDAESVRRMAGHLRNLLRAAAAFPERPVSQLAILNEVERRQLLIDCNRTEREYPRHLRIEQLFALQARRNPQATAVEEAGRTASASGGEQSTMRWTYGALNARANRLAYRLRRLGIGPESIAAVCMPSSADLVTVLLAVLKAGGTYLPLDRSDPPARLERMLSDCGASLLIGLKGLAPTLPEMKIPRLELAEGWKDEGDQPDDGPTPLGSPECAAYAMYTSGSTGRPKGILIPHRGVARLVLNAGYVDISPKDRVALAANVSFDASTFEIWGALLNGASLRVLGLEERLTAAALSDSLQKGGISVLFLTTSLFNKVAFERPTALKPLRYLIFGGEAADADAVANVVQACPEVELVNGYGPTENTTFSLCHKVVTVTTQPRRKMVTVTMPEAQKMVTVTKPIGLKTLRERVTVPSNPCEIPIGRPIGNTRSFVLDRHRNAVPVGVVGELFVGGDGLARGYLGRPAETANAFVPDHCSGEIGSRLYKTGDLARRLASGAVVFEGRIDDQVKLRGFRIELSEVRSVLNRHPAVAQCEVQLRRSSSGEEQLVAYLVANGESSKSSLDQDMELRCFAADHLPAYMVPSTFVRLAKLPLTANGKLDLRALPTPPCHSAVLQRSDQPLTSTEERLAALWIDLLGTDPIAREDDFFQLGGHSLLASRLLTRIFEVFELELPLAQVFENSVLHRQAAAIDSSQAGADPTPFPLSSDSPNVSQPASLEQQRLWLLSQLKGLESAYNMAAAVSIEGEIEAESLRWSLEEVRNRHSSLRSRFPAPGGRPLRLIDPGGAFALPIVDLSRLPVHLLEEENTRLALQESLRPFDLSLGPLLRSVLLRLTSDGARPSWTFLLSLHHIIADGWSFDVLFRELSNLYAAFRDRVASALPSLLHQYGSYVAWQRRKLTEQRQRELVDYWSDRLKPFREPLRFARIEAGDSGRQPDGRRARFDPDPQLLSCTLSLGRRVGATPFMTLLCFYSILLTRWSGMRRLVIGIPVANRQRPETRDMIGLLVNSLPAVFDWEEDDSVENGLLRVKSMLLEALRRSDLPFNRLVEAVKADRDHDSNPIFQTMFSLQQAPLSNLSLAGSDVSLLETGVCFPKFDLLLTMEEDSAGLGGCIEYDSRIFSEATVLRLFAHYRTLVAAGAADPLSLISELPSMIPSERRQLETLNRTDRDIPSAAGLVGIFAAVVRECSRLDAVLEADSGRSISYRDLDRRSSRLASFLKGEGIEPGELVGVCVRRSIEWIVGLLGILKAQAAYLPLDPSYPSERLAFMLRDSNARLVLTGKTSNQRFIDAWADSVCLDSDWTRIEKAVDSLEVRPISGAELAYVMYTSGSTGEPKGIAVPQKAVVRLVMDCGYIRWARGDRVLQLSNASFDAATFEIWGALLNGGVLVILPREDSLSARRLETRIREHQVTSLFLTAALFHRIAEARPEAFSQVRDLLVGGEAVDPQSAKRVLECGAPPRRLLNGYGPTENTTFSTTHRIRAVESDSPTVPIGRPFSNSRAYVLDRDLRPLPIGVPGELHLGGEGLAWGYWNRPGLTAERFVPDPMAIECGQRLYRSGDLSRWNDDWRLEFLGRYDDQLKIRGFRVEPGEIAAAIESHPDMSQAAVVLDSTSEQRPLRAFAALSEPGRLTEQSALAKEVRAYLGELLPEFMLPASIHFLETMPLTSNGKIDRAALLGIARTASPRTPFNPPRSAVQELIAGIWCDLLGLEAVSLEDDFFDLGGHSLLATQAVSRLRQALSTDLTLETFFRDSTLQDLSRAVEDALRYGLERDHDSVRPLPRPDQPPLSFAQQRLWILSQMEGAQSIYNMTFGLRLQGVLNGHALTLALDEIVRRHEVLRTSFPTGRDSLPWQRVHSSESISLPIVDLSRLSDRHRKDQWRRMAQADVRRPFDLAYAPLMRACLLVLANPEGEAVASSSATPEETRQLSVPGADRVHAHGENGDWTLLLTIHHIVFDGWSMHLLLQELAAHYAAIERHNGFEQAGFPPPPLRGLEIQYADFASWQRQWLQASNLSEQIGFWKKQLEDAPSILELPLDRRRPPVQTYRGALSFSSLGDAQLMGQLQSLSRQSETTLFMTLLAAFATLLWRWSGESDLLVGTPIANRNRAETENLIGFFVNTLALRIGLENNLPFSELLSQVRQTALGAYSNQDLPFEKLVEEIGPRRHPGYSPLFQVMFELQEEADFEADLPHLSMRLEPVESGISLFDLILIVKRARCGLTCVFEYNRDLFRAGTIERIARCWETLVAAIPNSSPNRVGDLPLLSDRERKQLVEASVLGVASDLLNHEGECVHEAFQCLVLQSPQAIALIWGRTAITYSELNRRANRIAHRLLELGFGPESRVAILLERQPELIAAELAVLKAGGAFLPLDPSFPGHRLRSICRDSGSEVLITSTEAALSGRGLEIPTLLLDDPVELCALQACSEADPESNAFPDSLAYVIYTSGSTGAPKGVEIRHRGLLTYCRAFIQACRITPEDRVLQSCTQSFDLSLEEIFSALLSGATLFICPEPVRASFEAFTSFVEERELTFLDLATSYWDSWTHWLLDSATRMPKCVRMIVSGSEAASMQTLQRWRREFGSKVAWRNSYGITETTIGSTLYSSDPDPAENKAPASMTVTSHEVTVTSNRPQSRRKHRVTVTKPKAGVEDDLGVTVPIGRPLRGVSIQVLDQGFEPQPQGFPGELFIGGSGLARGYLADPRSTAARFVPNPFVARPGARMFRSGDRGRLLDSGDIEFLGRLDRQVKIRGFRIEPGEIESALSKIESVREAAVAPIEGSDKGMRLQAFVAAKPGTELRTDNLADALRESLPEWMVPTSFRILPELPRKASGKVDFGALDSLPADSESERAEQGPWRPLSQTERRLAEIWKELLELDRIGRHASFFELGGHSLLLIRMQSRIRQEFGDALSIAELFRLPTLALLANRLSGSAPLRTRPRLERDLSQGNSDIAVIGMGLRFPGANEAETYWRNLCEGVESIRFFTPEELESEGLDPRLIRRSDYVPAAGILDDYDGFDASFFGFSDDEAKLLDPQLRLFLECSWEAMEDAGYAPGTLRETVGVYAGASLSSYLANVILKRPDVVDRVGGHRISAANEKESLAFYASYKLGLTGPSLGVQAGCATSLVAVHEACRSLRQGECELALAGASSVHVPHKTGYTYHRDAIYSADGHCRAFDAKAQGTVMSNGAAVLVLRRLDQAQSSGDRIVAVIKGSAVSNDGAQRPGFAAPGVTGLMQAVRNAHRDAAVHPRTVTYVEAHGTGTLLGDSVEITAMTEAFRRGGAHENGFCALGSVKTNLGHLDAASGMAGLIKACLAVQKGKLPPHLHFENSNPDIDFDSSPFFVNTEFRDWNQEAFDDSNREAFPRRAGVSSITMGGTNCHIVLEEPPARALVAPPTREWHLLTLSAKSHSALENSTERLTECLVEVPPVRRSPLGDQEERGRDTLAADVAFTLSVGRHPFAFRRVVLCRSPEEAQSTMASRPADRFMDGQASELRTPLAFFLPDPWLQVPMSGSQLCRTESVFRDRLDLCAKVLGTRFGVDLYAEIGCENAEGQAEGNPNRRNASSGRMDDRAVSKLSRLALQYSLAKLWIHWGVIPEALIGSGPSQYMAACLADVLSLEEALLAAHLYIKNDKRAHHQQQLRVSLESKDMEQRLTSWLDVESRQALRIQGDDGCQDGCVVNGPLDALEWLEARLTIEGKAFAALLDRSGGHRKMPSRQLEEVSRALAETALSPPKTPMLSCLSGDWIGNDEATDPVYWAGLQASPHRMTRALSKLLEPSKHLILELGFGGEPCRLNGTQASVGPSQVRTEKMSDCDEQSKECKSMVSTLGRLWLAGVEVDWVAFHEGQPRQRLALPTYPFERGTFRIEPPDRQRTTVDLSSSSWNEKPKWAEGTPTHAQRLPFEQWFCTPSWRRLPALPERPCDATASSQRPWLIFADECGLGGELLKKAESIGQPAIEIRQGRGFERLGACSFAIGMPRCEDYQLLMRSIGRRPAKIVHCWGVTAERNGGDRRQGSNALEAGFMSLAFIAQALSIFKNQDDLEIVAISNGMQEVEGDETIVAEKAAVLGAINVIPLESPGIACRSIDLRLPSEAEARDQLTARLFLDLRLGNSERITALRGRHRWAWSAEAFSLERPTALPPLSASEADSRTFLIAGGLGGIGLTIAETLAPGSRLVLTHRSGFPPPETWEAWLGNPASERSIVERILKLRRLVDLGAQLWIRQVDVADGEAMHDLVSWMMKSFGRLDGVIHAAGHAESGLLRMRTRSDFERVLRTKIEGTRVLAESVRSCRPQFVVLCSSMAAIKGVVGQGDYCAANAFQDAFVHSGAFGSETRVISINWDVWRDVGMAARAVQYSSADFLANQTDRLLVGIRPSEGAKAFVAALESGLPRLLVSPVPPSGRFGC